MEEAQVDPDLGRNVEHIRVKCGSWRQVDLILNNKSVKSNYQGNEGSIYQGCGSKPRSTAHE